MTVENFSWVVESVLAGSAQIGGFGWCGDSNETELGKDLDTLGRVGIKAMVSLTSTPLRAEVLEVRDIRYLHLPVADMQAPDLALVEQFITFANRARRDRRPVLVHCGAGLGRTGTLLACYLVHQGAKGDEALKEIRAMRPGSVETIEQEAVVHRYHRHLNRGDVKPDTLPSGPVDSESSAG